MGFLQNWDKFLFGKINDGFPIDGLDPLAIFVSNYQTWWFAAFLILVVSLLLKRRSWLKILLCCVISLGTNDMVNSYVLKPTFKRERPCYQMEVHLRNGHCGSHYGMPSNHASNGAAVLATAAFWLPKGVVGLIAFLVILVGWSRVYLGVHFPFDVLCGYFVGATIGILVTLSLMKISSYIRGFHKKRYQS